MTPHLFGARRSIRSAARTSSSSGWAKLAKATFRASSSETYPKAIAGAAEAYFAPVTKRRRTGAAVAWWHGVTTEARANDFVATLEWCWISGDVGRCEGTVAIMLFPHTAQPEGYEAEIAATHMRSPNEIPCEIGSAEFAGHYDLSPEDSDRESVHIDHAF